ncbi:MAG: ABC transporter ATP-binding protein [Actinomycetota bacterium]
MTTSDDPDRGHLAAPEIAAARAGSESISAPIGGDAAPTLSCRHLGLAYGTTPALRDATLAVSRGEAVAVVGPSGSGKSTLLQCLAGLRVPDTGDVLVDGEPFSSLSDRLRSRARLERMGVIFQFGELLPELTLVDNIALPLWFHPGGSQPAAAARATELLEAFGIGDLAGRYPGEVSGGERQRVAVARAMVHDPILVLADEPTGSLDSTNADLVMAALLERARNRGLALLLVTHERRFAELCDRTLTMVDGQVTDGDTTR